MNFDIKCNIEKQNEMSSKYRERITEFVNEMAQYPIEKQDSYR